MLERISFIAALSYLPFACRHSVMITFFIEFLMSYFECWTLGWVCTEVSLCRFSDRVSGLLALWVFDVDGIMICIIVCDDTCV